MTGIAPDGLGVFMQGVLKTVLQPPPTYLLCFRLLHTPFCCLGLRLLTGRVLSAFKRRDNYRICVKVNKTT
jgi:hypothetical protein